MAVIITFIILVNKTTKASESLIRCCVQLGFKLDIHKENPYILSHIYIKEGYT